VVWEDGGSNPASYPIRERKTPVVLTCEETTRRESHGNMVLPSEGKRSEAKGTTGSQSALIVPKKSANSALEESMEGSEASKY